MTLNQLIEMSSLLRTKIFLFIHDSGERPISVPNNMDSCHLFNFLFGSRKTTSELSKQFRTSFNEVTGKRSKQNKPANSIGDAPNGSENEKQPPRSPLKQIQSKIANFANPPRKSQTETVCCNSDCDPKCGTYHAKLVKSDELSNIEKQSKTLIDEKNNLSCKAENNLPVTNQPNETIHLSHSEIFSATNLQNDGQVNKVVSYDNSPPELNGSNLVIASTEIYEVDSVQANSVSRDVSAISRQFQDSQVSVENEINVSDKSDCHIKREAYRELNKKVAKSERVKNLVQSFEFSSASQYNQQTNDHIDTPRSFIKLKWPPEQQQDDGSQKEKPITIVKPLPPKTPPKSTKVKFLNFQLRLNKPTKVEQLFQDEDFLCKLFGKLEPIDRCAAAQVCRLWRKILYSNQSYWRDLISVIDCTQLRREHLLECIINTLHSAKLKYQIQSNYHQNGILNAQYNHKTTDSITVNIQTPMTIYRSSQLNIDMDTADLDQDEVWKIQELCQKFARGANNYSSRSSVGDQHPHTTANGPNQHQHDNQPTVTPKSSSIPSQISSTISSASISSLLSPLSEYSRVDSIKEKLYTSLDDRGFEAICLYGASDDDIQDLVCKTSTRTHKRILVGRLDNCCITDQGLELFITTFDQIEELELSGCNEITNSIELKSLQSLQRLIITDCINIADGLASRLIDMFHQLSELTILAYHLTDAFLEYISLNSDTSKLRNLGLPNCKEITNHSMLTIAKYFPNIERLSISGSTKISDDGIELLTEQAKNLITLDLSWCTKISDISLECISCDLSATLRELILDRNINITDIGLGYLATMTNLSLLYIRWCSRITDIGLESVLSIRSLRHLSLAGLHQITARSLLCLIEANSLEEVELTNCPAVNNDLLKFLSSKMPKCNIVY